MNNSWNIILYKNCDMRLLKKEIIISVETWEDYFVLKIIALIIIIFYFFRSTHISLFFICDYECFEEFDNRVNRPLKLYICFFDNLFFHYKFHIITIILFDTFCLISDKISDFKLLLFRLHSMIRKLRAINFYFLCR